LKNTHLLRYAHPSSLRRTEKYASFLRISRALHLDVFDQPGENSFFNKPLSIAPAMRGQAEKRHYPASFSASIRKYGDIRCEEDA
jgi:hypothetical protein